MERRQLLLWCEIAQGGMQAAAIVPAFQELEHVSPGFSARQVVALSDEFALQRGVEALHRRVVPAIAFCGSSNRRCRAVAIACGTHALRIEPRGPNGAPNLARVAHARWPCRARPARVRDRGG